MRKPDMIFFDYGHTLCYEPVQDYQAGWSAVMEHAVENPRGITAVELNDLCMGTYRKLFSQMRPLELETVGFNLDATIYDYLGLKFDVPLEELEYIRWCATEPIYPMEGIERFLSLCAGLGIRTAVISNISFSGNVLRRRIDEALPFHTFEFVVASSECVFRKPSEWIFRRAMGLAGVEPEQCWFIGDDVRCDIEGAARAGIWPIWFKCPLKCTYKPEARIPPQCMYKRVSAWDELGDILRSLI